MHPKTTSSPLRGTFTERIEKFRRRGNVSQEDDTKRPIRADRSPETASSPQSGTGAPVQAALLDSADTRYDHSLAEFPAFRFGKRRSGSEALIRFTDTIAVPGSSQERLERSWTVYPSARWGYGGATTQALLFDLHQIWKADGFRGTRIHFGTPISRPDTSIEARSTMHEHEEATKQRPRGAAMTTSRDWTKPTRHHEAAEALDHDIKTMSEEPGSGVRMCHEQGKTAVYLSRDGRFVIEHEPHGPVRHVALELLAHGST